jgi:hypothetical protein
MEIGKKHSIHGADLVQYNFLTKDSSEINWYLANYVGCPAPKPGQKYDEFLGALYDETKNTGVIFIPKPSRMAIHWPKVNTPIG